MEEKKGGMIEVKLPNFCGRLEIKRSEITGGTNLEIAFPPNQAAYFCGELLSEIYRGESVAEAVFLRDKMIRIFEAKFGIRVEVCGFCRYYGGHREEEFCDHPKGKINKRPTFLMYFGSQCRFGDWKPKEV